MSASRPLICQVVHSLNIGGAEILAANLARRLRDQFQFMFVCLDEAGSQREQLESEGFEVEVLGRQSGIDWTCMRSMATICKRRQVQLLHAHQYTPFFYSAASGLFRKRPPVLFTEHGRWYPDCRSTKRVLFNKCMLRKRDQVVGVGEHVRKALIENEGFSSCRVGVIYNGVNLRAFNSTSADPADDLTIRRELQIADDTLLIMQVARLDALKDHLTAVAAAAEVSKSHPNFCLLLIGEGPERQSIEAAIEQHSLHDWVRLLGARCDVNRLLPAADVFLLSSISEGIPLTIIEAMAAELPVVSTAVGGVPELVVDGETGFLAPAKQPTQLAAALVKLATNPELRKAMGAAGKARAQQLFSDEKMNAHYAAAYEEMLRG